VISDPVLDLGTQPELHTALTKVDHRARHIRVTVLVDAHGVVTRHAKDFGDAVSVKKVIDDDGPRHAPEITSVLGSVRASE